MKNSYLSNDFSMRRSKFLIVILIVLGGGLGNLYAQSSYSAEGDYKHPGTWLFRGGLTGSVGYSLLSLSDNSRPAFASEENYTFSPDLFIIIGGIVTIQPGFMSRRWEFIIDPSLAKYSYGDGSAQTKGEFKTEVDIDAELLRAPLSIQYYFVNPTAKLKPFVRVGYAYSYLFENIASFASVNIITEEVFYSNEFKYAQSQNSISLSVGSEVNIGIGSYTFELVGEFGDGIHENKQAWNFFGSDSRTSSLFVRMAILF